MEIRIDKKELTEAIQIANLAVGSNAKLPVLNNILFEINEGNLMMTSTDLEVFIKHSISPCINYYFPSHKRDISL